MRRVVKEKPPKKERPPVINEATGEILVPWGTMEDKLKELCLV